MNKTSKTTVYPFDIRFCPALRHPSFIEKYEIVNLVSPNGWGYCGKDAGYVDGGNDIGLIVSGDFEEALEKSDNVLFVKPERKCDFDNLIYPKILKAIEKRKNLTVAIEMETEYKEELVKLAEKNGVEIQFYSPTVALNTHIFNEEIFEVGVPVIFVLGMGERTSKFELQLSLAENLVSMGYKVSQICSRTFSELLSLHSFPRFMNDPAISEPVKIVLFNRYLKMIEQEEDPDIIIVGIPGGIMPFNAQYTNKFGVTAFEISQAVTPDIAILSMICDEYNDKYIDSISNSLKYKFGYGIDYFNMSNATIDWMSSKGNSTVQHITLEAEFVDEKVKRHRNAGLPVYNVFNKSDMDILVNLIIDKLSGYADIECV